MFYNNSDPFGAARAYIAQRQAANNLKESGPPESAFADQNRQLAEITRKYGFQDSGAPQSAFAPMGAGFNPSGPQAPGLMPTFARPIESFQTPAGPNPQAAKLTQAFQPPARPTFTDPARSMAPPGIGDFGGMPSPTQGPMAKPKGPITPKSPSVNVVGGQAPQSSDTPSAGSGSQQQPFPREPENPWINPAVLNAMGQNASGADAAKKPGEGLAAFVNSGAPSLFKQPAQGPMPDGTTLDKQPGMGGGLGEKGSVMSMLTGGSEMDPKSALSGILKLFGGFGGFGL